MKVVCNTSPLINLAWVGQINLIHQLFGEILIPPAVWDEVVIHGKGQPGCQEVQEAKWIIVKKPANQTLIQSFQQSLDIGESEAIALAVEEKANLLIMDEKRGRETANFMGIKTIGLVGILVIAKQKKQVDSIKPIFDDLRSKAGFYLDKNLYHKILNDLGE